jgi:hypothetical protein
MTRTAEAVLFARADELVRRAQVRSLDRRIAAVSQPGVPVDDRDVVALRAIINSNPGEFRGVDVRRFRRLPDGTYTLPRGGGGNPTMQRRVL